MLISFSPYTAVIDPTGTGKFSHGILATVTTQVPGNNGNIAPPNHRRFITRMLARLGLAKRAATINEDFPFAATIPPGITCSGNAGGQTGVCLVKIVNPSGAGPFGGVVAIQMASSGTETGASNSANAGNAGTSCGNGAETGNAGSTSGGNTQAISNERIGVIDETVRLGFVATKFRA